jgi:chromosome partitioning protein
MARGTVSTTLLVAAVVVSGAFALGGQPTAAQRGEPSGDRVQPPAELLKEYPFEQGRLDGRAGSDGQRADANGSGGGGWPSIWLLVAAVTALLVLGLVARRVPRASKGEDGEAPEPDPPVDSAPAAMGSAGRSRPPRFARARTRRRPRNRYAVVNQKGGVGKTTVSLALGAAAVRRGRRVLLVDLDPQASATSVAGAQVPSAPTVADVILAHVDCTLEDAVSPTGWGFDLAPADRLLRSADSPIACGDEDALAQHMGAVADYDLILMDCPPSLGALTINALTAASHALVVTEPTFLALQAMEDLFDTMRMVAVEHNPTLELAGLVLNRVEATADHKSGVAELEDAFGAHIWEPHVPKRAILQDAMRRGVAPQDLQTHSHYAEEITAIFDALAVRVETTQVKA